MLRFVSFFRTYLPRYLRKKTRYICLYLKIFGRIMVGFCLLSHTPFLILYLACDRDNNEGYLHSQSQSAEKTAP